MSVSPADSLHCCCGHPLAPDLMWSLIIPHPEYYNSLLTGPSASNILILQSIHLLKHQFDHIAPSVCPSFQQLSSVFRVETTFLSTAFRAFHDLAFSLLSGHILHLHHSIPDPSLNRPSSSRLVPHLETASPVSPLPLCPPSKPSLNVTMSSPQPPSLVS